MPELSLFRRAAAPFGRLFDLEGRTRRADYWPFMLLLLAIYTAGIVMTGAGMSAGLGLSIGPAYAVAALVALLAWAATVRRLHDVCWSGRWVSVYVLMMLAFIASYFYLRYAVGPQTYEEDPSPLFWLMPAMMAFGLAMNAIGLLILILAVLDGTPGPNRYGTDPKGRSAS